MTLVSQLVLMALSVCVTVAVIRTMRQEERTGCDRSGWVYFIGGEQGPILFGSCDEDPRATRLAEVKAASPFPVKVIFSAEVPDRYVAEAAGGKLLDDCRVRGDWYDRDTALYYIDVLRGEE